MGCLVKMKNSQNLTNNSTILKREGKEKAKSKVKLFTTPTALYIDIRSYMVLHALYKILYLISMPLQGKYSKTSEKENVLKELFQY